MATTPRAFIFDCDGTLLDSMGMWLSVQPRLLASYGFETTPSDFAAFEHLSVEEECEAYHETWGVGESGADVYERLQRLLERGYAEDVVPREGALAFLEEAHAAGIPMAVATSTPAAFVRQGLERWGMERYISRVTTTDESGKSKEHPDVYNLALARLCEDFGLGDVSPEEAWVFEDTVFGLKSSGSAGYRRVGIYDPAGRCARADVFANAEIGVDSYTELPLSRILSFEA